MATTAAAQSDERIREEEERATLQENQVQDELDRKTDSLLTEIGGFGRYQMFILGTYLCYTKSMAIIMLNLSFLEKVPREYFCVFEGSTNSVPC